MARSDRHSGGSTSTALLQHQHVQDHVHMVEEYVLDELDLNSLRLFDMPPARIDRSSRNVHAQQHQQQRHVRRSAELRTVSIIETLSELVSRTDNGHLTGTEHVGGDCDGQCHQQQQQQPSQFGGGRHRNQQCHTCPSVRNGTATGKLNNWTACVEPNGSADFKAVVNGRVQPTAMLELSPIPYWKSPAERAQRQRPTITMKKDDNPCAHCSQEYCRDDHVDAVPPPARHHQSQSLQCETTSRKGAMCFKYSAVQNGIKKKVSPTLVGGGGGGGGGVVATKVRSEFSNSGSQTTDRAIHRTVGLCADCRPIRDPNHFMMSTLRSKGRTPDWIAGIFSIARRGNLERLRHALSDMDATLIRNLSDHRGNNLFHVCCCYGHLECLQWLLQRGKQCEDAILDENKYELTPLVCAVKYGKTPCVEWLISNTIARSQLVPPTGSRPLLHWAAKYGQEVILRWLAEYMESNTMDVNVKDGYGNTSLHLAAKHGHATSIKALVTHRCDVSLKNDLGYKASDYAILYGQVACSEYLLSLEACLLMSASVASLDYDLNSAKAEISELKTQFKDVLSCAKKLVKEREELHQHLNRSEDGLTQLNKSIVTEIRALVEENVSLREKLNGSSKNHANPSARMDETIAGMCHAMHARWQESQQRWLPVIALSEIQQKILLAEEKWKRARARVTWNEGRENREHMEVFRDKLTQVQCRATGIRLTDIRSISSSESSLASMEDTMSEYEDRYGQVSSSDPLPCSLDAVNSCNCHDVMDDRRCVALAKQQSLSDIVASRRPIADSISGSVESGAASLSTATGTTKTRSLEVSKKDKQHVNACSVTEMNSSGSQGTCKVLEVIVSSNSGDDNDGDLKSVRRRKNKPNSVHCKSELLECHRHTGRDDDDDDDDAAADGSNDSKNNGRKGVKCNGNAADCNCKTEKGGTKWSPSREQDKNPTSSRAPQLRTKNGFLISSEPDLIVGTKGIRILPSASTLVTECDDVAPKARREVPIASQEQVSAIEGECVNNAVTRETDIHGGLDAENIQHSFSTDTSRDSACANDEIPLIGEASSSGIYPYATTKRKGFLQKLTLRWPSKRKVKTSKKVQEISAEEFRETYLHLRNGNGDETIYEMHDPSDGDPSPRDLVIFDTPTAATSADHETKVITGPLNVNTRTRSKSQALINTETGSELPSTGMSSKTMSQLDLDSAPSAFNEQSTSKLCPNGLYLRSALSCPSELPTIGKTSSTLATKKVTLHTQKPSFSGSLDHGRNVSPPGKDNVQEEDDDEDDEDDDNKEESPPEAEQGMSFERPLSLAPEGEEDASSIHAQAHLPPKRPTSHCMKSDHYFSRPESSASRTESCSAFRLPAGFPLRKVSSVSTDLLTPVDSMTPSRMSPAPSEVSKTESALLSPSTTESLRQLGRIEEIAGRDARPILPILRVTPSKAEIKTAHIVDIHADEPASIKPDVKEIVDCLLSKDVKSTQLEEVMAVVEKTSHEVNGESALEKTTSSKVNSDVMPLTLPKHINIQKAQKAWYELSDDEEILMPETLTTRNGPIAKSSSEEDETYFCT